ncbi:ADP-ribosylation/Crystallin J1 [Balamuthia mandrillaris]
MEASSKAEHHDTQRFDSKARAIGAIVGALVADAACMGLHWIYDHNKLQELVGEEGRPEFHEPPACPFYSYEPGRNTPYGEQTLKLLEIVAEGGAFDVAEAVEKHRLYFDPEAGSYTGRLDHSMKGFLANVKAGKKYPECGSDDEQANGMARICSIVARYAGQEELLDRVDEAIRMTQNTDKAVAMGMAAARALEYVILGSSPKDAIQATLSDLRSPTRKHAKEADVEVLQKMEEALQLAKSGVGHYEAVAKIGLSCAFPYSLQNGVHIMSLEEPKSYQDAVRDSILAAGDSASRLLWIGACLGAHYGVDAIPAEWKAATNEYARVLALAQKVVEAAPYRCEE